MNAYNTSAVSSILDEVEHVISGIDYGDAYDDVLVFDEIGQSQRQPALIVSGSTDEQESRLMDYDFNDDDADADTTMAIIGTKKKRTWRKPEDKPKRPLSAYNLFFQLERERLVSGDAQKNVLREEITAVCEQHKLKKEKRKHRKTHGKIGFADLARTIASRWRNLKPPTKSMYEDCAAIEKARYQKDVAEWVKNQAIKEKRSEDISNQTPPEEATCMPPNTVLSPMPPPDFPMKSRQQSMANFYQQTPFSTSESLHKLMASGLSYTQYQSSVHQQRQEIEVEITHNRRMVQETQRQIMMSSFATPSPAHTGMPYQGLHANTPYTSQIPSAHYSGPRPISSFPGQGNCNSLQGQGNRPPSFSTTLPGYEDHFNSGPGDYYGMAEQTYQMVQMTLRTQSRSVNPPFHMGVGMGGMGMGGGLGICSPNRVFPAHSSFEPLDQANEVTPTPSPRQLQQIQEEEEEEVILDPHTGLSSPTFGSTGREDSEPPRLELTQLLASFENA